MEEAAWTQNTRRLEKFSKEATKTIYFTLTFPLGFRKYRPGRWMGNQITLIK